MIKASITSARADDPPDLVGESEERDHLGLGASPDLADGVKFQPPVAPLEGCERLLASLGVDGAVNVLQGRCDGFAVVEVDEIEAVAQQVGDACLGRGVGKHGGDRIGEG